ncbi:hypothetical protein CANARDRAFT_6904 [[Candida] arabinofermentans NRRL YB-2248]|uniref:ATPase inhibitor, mitochondrial n=1 Tax=[Candida] arabinofermentans NRRL YB-2248 TaxID=983967 RepID=A0A1E4T3Y4_9ASCO|nr:hypothetical protein CANARDRAFT_6904 [[Candida] arabinofermentans NRRL YB-2248]
MFAKRSLSLISKSTRLNTIAMRSYTEGATGATRPDGSSDSFTKREKAQEDLYVKKHQAEQIAKLKEQLAKQKEQLDELENKLK